ncbi:sulfur carrier protein ThiS [Crenobacter cavernae]|uniref:Sulfur carrier protein ThiS n=1 Tax=Crenobacter cavernae TaxID=2290923 RepID=A0A345YA39_9NEIS|nr:sulfur carrier protein ThiS [Crenobacter cavernae]RXZ43617.1 sulfur carrier protein ThiS [Crenobacter cavernae]
MNIFVNGEARQFEGVSSVLDLVDALGLAGQRIAIERNGEIVPRSRHGEQTLAEGDRLEMVVAVGGG